MKYIYKGQFMSSIFYEQIL